MIPAFTLSGVLPPFSGSSPAVRGKESPFQVTMTEIAARLCSTLERETLFRRWVGLRKQLRAVGIEKAVQWIDGSFCEDCERTRGRPPADIDLVTLFLRPAAVAADPAWQAFVAKNKPLFDSEQTKRDYGCDAFYVDVGLPGFRVYRQITYWHGLFTHQRGSFQWKGILEVQLDSDDDLAIEQLDARATGNEKA